VYLIALQVAPPSSPIGGTRRGGATTYRRGRRVSLGRVLPRLLAAERRQVEEGPDAAERLDAAAGGEVRAIDLLAVAKEHAQAERLAVLILARSRTLGADAKGVVEGALKQGEPRDGPSHALAVGLDPRDRRARDERKGGVARM
jgi:hypothetical protein